MKRHRTDVVSLLFGLLFISLSAWWAVAYYLDWTLRWNVPNFGWFAAGVLIVVGLLGVVASLRGDRPEPALVDGPESFDDAADKRCGGNARRQSTTTRCTGHRLAHAGSRSSRLDPYGRTPGRPILTDDSNQIAARPVPGRAAMGVRAGAYAGPWRTPDRPDVPAGCALRRTCTRRMCTAAQGGDRSCRRACRPSENSSSRPASHRPPPPRSRPISRVTPGPSTAWSWARGHSRQC